MRAQREQEGGDGKPDNSVCNIASLTGARHHRFACSVSVCHTISRAVPPSAES